MVLLLAATGCSLLAAPMQRADLLGIWEARTDDHTITLELSGDGSLHIENLPRAVLAIGDHTVALDWNDTLDVTGSWSLPHSGSPFYISLDDAGDPGHYGSFVVQPSAGELHTSYGYYEDPDRLTFSRTEGPSTPAPPTLTRHDLIGQWLSTNGGSGPLTLSSDNTFIIEDLPAELVALNTEPVPGDSTTDLTGRWSVHEEPLPLRDNAGPFLHDLTTPLHLELPSISGMTLRREDGALTLSYRDGAATWRLSGPDRS